MKFFHLSDLHIGKQLHRYNLKEDQQVILKEVITYAKELRPDAIVIAGDIYDKSVPSAEAVNVFDEFLTRSFRDYTRDSDSDYQWKPRFAGSSEVCI